MTACSCKPKPQPKLSLLAWIIPATILVLLPKCPLCIVVWAAWLGIALSFSAAAMIRYGVIATCLVALTALLARVFVVRKR